jgi:transcriptional repressor NrdR
MVCIYCAGETQVINSRLQRRANQVWRRRRCLACATVFTTHESPDLSTSLVVQYNQRDLRPFSRDSLFISLYEALRHRPSAQEDAHALTATVVGFLLKEAAEGTIKREVLVKTAAAVLERFDVAAATMYRAYHKQ